MTDQTDTYTARYGHEPCVVLDTRVVTGLGGGPEKTILNSPRYLDSAGYRMLCAYMHPPQDPGFEQIRRRAEELEAPLLSIPDRGPWDLSVIRRLLEICRRERVAIWHGHDYKSNLLGLMLRPFWPMRLVTTVHGWVHQTARTPLYYRIDRMCLRRYEHVLCVSQDIHELCLREGVPPERCTLLENGIDTDRFTRRRSPRDAKPRFGVDPDRPTIGAMGRLSPEKGFDLLIQAASRLLRRGHDFDLVIAGEGSARADLQRLIAELGCADRVRLVGFVADTLGFFETLDQFALSSLREGLPNVLLEAMAMEVPVVSTRIAGVPRLITHDENGLLVEPGSIDALEQAIEELLEDPTHRSRLARAGRQTILTRFRFQDRMARLAALYDQMLRDESPAPISPSAS